MSNFQTEPISHPPFIYFSQHCKHCHELRVLLTTLKIENKFQMLCVDNPTIRSNLPPFVKRVPTLVQWNQNKTVHSLYEGEQVIQWIQTNMKSKPDVESRFGSGSTVPVEYMKSDVPGYSDQFSFLDPANTTLDQHYNSINNIDAMHPENKVIDRPKETAGKMADFDSALERLCKERESFVVPPVRRL